MSCNILTHWSNELSLKKNQDTLNFTSIRTVDKKLNQPKKESIRKLKSKK
jgi:hypothetical protein